MDFKLHAPYSATGDQPEAIRKLTEGVRLGLDEQVLLGVTGSGKTFTMASVIAHLNRPTLVLAHNKTLAAQLCSEFREFFPENAVEYFISYYDYYQPEAYIAHTDTYIEKDSAINDEIERLRHSATSSLFERRDVIVVSSVSCIYGLGDPIDYKNMVISLRTGMEKSREELMQALDEHFSFARFLLDNGSPMNEEQAMYSVASPAELPEIAGLLQRNRLLALARTGVEIYDASSCYVEPSVRVAPGARLLPGTMLRGKTVIGEEAVIGPWSVIDDSVIGARAVVNASQVRESRVGQDAVVGPYASVRGGCELGRSVRAGSFVELKNARLGENTQVPHLAYLGDTEAGANCNFGCGVTTANFDRVQKHETVVGEGAFIGCNTALIAPLQVGSGAYIGAGSTITEDVPAQALGPPVQQEGMGRKAQEIIPSRSQNIERRADAALGK